MSIILSLVNTQNETGRTAHELEHGRQFLDAEIDFALNNKGKSSGGLSRDFNDEDKAIEIGALIHNASRSFEGTFTEDQKEEHRISYSDMTKRDLRANEYTSRQAKYLYDNIEKYMTIFDYEPNED